MDNDEDLIVKVEEETTGQTVETKKEEEKQRDDKGRFVAAEPEDDLAAQFASLKAEKEATDRAKAESDRRAAEAERRATEATKRATEAQTEALTGQAGAVDAGISAAQAEADAAEKEYKVAFESGDAAAAAKAQRVLARAEARIERLNEAKADLASRSERGPEPKTEERTDTASDPFENYVRQFSQPTAEWLRSHRDWVTDSKKSQKLQEAHFNAVNSDLSPDTPEYFQHVEKFIGIRKDEPRKTNGNGNGHDTTTRRRAAAPPAAPVHQSGGGVSGSSGTEVVLTRGEAAAAQDGTHVWNYDDPSPQKKFRKGDPIGVQEFARRKLELSRQGAYDRTYVEQ